MKIYEIKPLTKCRTSGRYCNEHGELSSLSARILSPSCTAKDTNMMKSRKAENVTYTSTSNEVNQPIV